MSVVERPAAERPAAERPAAERVAVPEHKVAAQKDEALECEGVLQDEGPDIAVAQAQRSALVQVMRGPLEASLCQASTAQRLRSD